MSKLLVMDVVSLEKDHLESSAPNLAGLGHEGFVADMIPSFPAVTCTVQSSMLTGKKVSEHGIVGNGWYFRDLAEVMFWRQSDYLVQAPKIWERMREKRNDFKSAKLFWWYNMYSSVDWSVTVRPHYTADGRKFPGIYTAPSFLEKDLEKKLGVFPLFKFWGPEAGISSTRWIVDSSLQMINKFGPDLVLVYLPHVDYDFQRFGPKSEQAFSAVKNLDDEAGRLISFARERGYEVLVVSEYAMTEVKGAVMINRILREHRFIKVRESCGRELLDCGASPAFAVSDHQVAHVYIKDLSEKKAVYDLLTSVEGIGDVLDTEEKKKLGLEHERSGDLVALSKPDRWFAYPWWFDDEKAPDFAHTVDIHRKPGYDPAELFYDPEINFPALRASWKLLLKTLGFRVIFDLIGVDTSLVRGSHGLVLAEENHLPVVIGSNGKFGREIFQATDIFNLMEKMLD